MIWLNNYKHVWRTAILLLLLVALMGPWAFDLISVPEEYACSPPNFRLEGDFCGIPLSGLWILFWSSGEIISMTVGFIRGEIVLDGTGTFLGLLFIGIFLFLILSPIISTLRQFRGGDIQDRQVSHIVVWGLAALFSSLFLITYGISRQYWALWGLWLYIGLAAGALVLEALLFTTKRRASLE